MTLTLIKSGPTKAVDRVPIPIMNVGTIPIYDVRAQFISGIPENVTLKVEGPVSTSILLPGQQLIPPLVVVGESSVDKVHDSIAKLNITGIVEGRRVVLRTIDVGVRTGTSSCLRMSAVNTPLLFVSSELTGTIAQRVTLRNECWAVRITQVSSSVGTNTFTISIEKTKYWKE